MVYIGVDEGRDESLYLLSQLVSNHGLDQGLDEVSNLGNTVTFEVNGDVVLVDDEINSVALHSEGHSGEGSSLGREVKSEISSNVGDVDLSSTGGSDEQVREAEITGDVGGQFCDVEFDSVGGRVQHELDILGLGRLIKGEVNVGDVTSRNLLGGDAHVLEVAKDVGSNDVVEGVYTSF